MNVEKMTLQEFVEKVRQMRYYQRRFRSSQKLEVKKELDEKEKEIDSIISLFSVNQQKLF